MGKKNNKNSKPKNKHTSRAKKLIIAGAICLIVALAFIGTEVVPFIIFLVATLALFFFAFREIKAYKDEQAQLEATIRQAQEKAKEREAKRIADRETMDKGLYPAFCNKKYDYSKMVVADLETTGLDSERDEILQLSVTDMYGNELFDHYIKPQHKRIWVEAQEKNNISPEMVADEKHITEYEDELRELFKGKTIVGYNISFDAGFLMRAGLISSTTKFLDIMKPFAEIYGDYDSYHNDYKWKKLTVCAKYYGYKWDGKAHNSLADCKATAYCFRKMSGAEQ